MRKIVLTMSVSLDGYIESPDQDISWHRVNQEMKDHFLEFLRPMSAFLSGRITWELMARFWPTADKDHPEDPFMVDFSGIWKSKPKILYSRTLEQAAWNTTLCREVDPVRIRALKAQEGGDMTVGGAVLAAEFMRHDLIDEYRVYVHPVLLGKGKPLFGPMEGRMDLTLAGTHRFGNGVVLSRYLRG
jgi:dihydrofolate reductase